MLSRLSSTDKVSIFALGRMVAEEHGVKTIAELAAGLSVPLMNEWRNRSAIVERLSAPSETEGFSVSAVPAAAFDPARFLITGLLIQSGAIRENGERCSYAGWLKALVVDAHERGASYEVLAGLTGIGVETLKGFKASCPSLPSRAEMDETTRTILATWQGATDWHRRTLERFLAYFCNQHPKQAMSRDVMRTTLIHLGLHTPRGPKIKNVGAQVKRRFEPHAIWEGDGKEMRVVVNDLAIKVNWYAFIDQGVTLLVGSSIQGVETGAALIAALKRGERGIGVFPVGILIDNRLGESDLSEVSLFCREHGIVIVRTFPGNAKTNGTIEGNFSIFERQVGTIVIRGSTAEEIATSVAETIVEIFTQLRNHAPRAALGGRSPAVEGGEAIRPEHRRDAVEWLASRLGRELDDGEAKWALTERARPYWAQLSWESEQKIKRQLVRYPALDIVAAVARYLAQIERHPGERYGVEYFLAILRHKRESKAKDVYSEEYRAGLASFFALQRQPVADPQPLAEQIIEELVSTSKLVSPTERLLRLDALAWWLIDYGRRSTLALLWTEIGRQASRSISITLRWWSAVVEYLGERLGQMLYFEARRNIGDFEDRSAVAR